MNRCFEQRDILTLLLSEPGKISHGKTVEDSHLRRLVAYLNDDNRTDLPAFELKSILSALAGECQGNRNVSGGNKDKSQAKALTDRPPRKRAKRSRNNNLHSILRFVERIIQRRYKEKSERKERDSGFLENELKSYFGTKDASFQAEEEVLSLAFGMALNSIKRTVDNLRFDRPREINEKQNQSQDSHVSSVRIIHNSIISDGVIKIALRIIDSVVIIDRRERTIRNKLQQARKNIQLTSKAYCSDRRKKYEHLLKPTKRRHGNGVAKAKATEKSDASSQAKSIMEEKYSKQWEWLLQFRKRYEYESKAKDCVELQQEHFPCSHTEQIKEGLAADKKAQNDSTTPVTDEMEKKPECNFVIVRRKIETLDDISISSNDSDEEMEKEVSGSDAAKQVKNPSDNVDSDSKLDTGDGPVKTTASPRPESEPAQVDSITPTSPLAKTLSPYDKLDQETYELRLTLLDMPPGEFSSAEVVRHTVDEIQNLLSRYGDFDGASGIARCGDVFGGNRAVSNAKTVASTDREHDGRFPLNDAGVSALVKSFLTDATGALRAKAFLRSFVLPLMIEMNPSARAAAIGSSAEEKKVAKIQGKPASRLLTSLLANLARDRPMECTVSVIVPTLVLKKYNPSIASELEASYEPTRFQCELISRVLRGKDALSVSAITLLVEQVLPTTDGSTDSDSSTLDGMKWTEHTMPVLTACLNRQPTLPDDVVAKLAIYHLSPKSALSMSKSMKFSTLFHALVTNYGSQVKSTGRVDSLKDSASRLKTFMSKTIGLSLKKLS